MAEIITLMDDLEDGVVADARVIFGIDGKMYEIDLSAKNATKLRGFLAQYVDRARPHRVPAPTVSVSRPGGKSGYNREQLSAVRQWARRNGYPDLSDRGKIPGTVLVAFEAAGGLSQ